MRDRGLRPNLLILVVVAAMFMATLVPVQESALAQPRQRTSPYVFRITVDQCRHAPTTRAQTAFRVAGIPGFVTALHGIADCPIISAMSEVANSHYDNLAITQVDLDRDIAVVASAEVEALGIEGLAVADVTNAEVYENLEVIGYPYGKITQGFTTSVVATAKEKLDSLLVGVDRSTALLLRNSPSLEIDVLTLNADLVPGHSGAPLVTSDRALVGMADGGLKQGTVGIAWAIPWEDVTWQTVAEAQADLDTLREQNPELALLFSSTIYTADDYGEVTIRNITEESFDSYRSLIDVAFDIDAAGTPWVGDLRFTGTYNAQNPQVQRSIFASGDFALPGVNKMGYASIGDTSYFVVEDFCVPPTEDAAQMTQWLDDLYGSFRSLIGTPNASGARLGTLLGPDVIDGVATKHYLLAGASQEAPDGMSFTAKDTDIWVAAEGNYLVKMTFDLEFDDASDGWVGWMAGSLTLTDIGAGIGIELPDNCGDIAALDPEDINPAITPTVTPTLRSTPSASATRALAPAITPNSPPAITPAPTLRATRRASTLPPPAATPSSRRPSASMDAVTVEHNVEEDGLRGMQIHVPMTVNNLRGVQVGLGIYFFDDTGTPLLDNNDAYRASDGTVAAWWNFVPRDDSARYDDYMLFMPYDELDLPPGDYTLRLVVKLYDPINRRFMAESTPVEFSYSLPAPLPTPVAEPAVDDPSGAAYISDVEYDVVQAGEDGMLIHLNINALNLLDVPCWAVVYFEFADGTALQDYDGVYTNLDGTISVSAEFTPLYASTVFEDFTIFMPYSQLHMVAGTHDLHMVAQLVDQTTLTPFATSNYVDFWYTQE